MKSNYCLQIMQLGITMSETRQLVTTHNKQDELFLFIRNNHYKQKFLD